MNGFYQENQHFIKLKILGEMRNLSLKDRIIHYNRNLMPETRKRLVVYRQKVSTLNQRIQFYAEAIDYLKEYEFPLLLYSICFEKEAGELFKHLGGKIVNSAPVDFVDRFSVLKFLRSGGSSSLEDHTFQIFEQELRLKIERGTAVQDVRSELKNPEANKLSEWLSMVLSQKDSYDLIQMVLFHFAKYWSQHYAGNYNKGVVLLSKMERAIISSGFDKVKINLKAVVTTLDLCTNQLLTSPVIVPYLDSMDAARSRDKWVINGYLNKVHDFTVLLDKIDMLFKDLRTLSLVELYEAHISQVRHSIRIYEEEIRSRVLKGVLATSEDLKYFSDPVVYDSAKSDVLQLRLMNYIVRSNYIFY